MEEKIYKILDDLHNDFINQIDASLGIYKIYLQDKMSLLQKIRDSYINDPINTDKLIKILTSEMIKTEFDLNKIINHEMGIYYES
jgi:hypothetical protein